MAGPISDYVSHKVYYEISYLNRMTQFNEHIQLLKYN